MMLGYPVEKMIADARHVESGFEDAAKSPGLPPPSVWIFKLAAAQLDAYCDALELLDQIETLVESEEGSEIWTAFHMLSGGPDLLSRVQQLVRSSPDGKPWPPTPTPEEEPRT